MFAKVWQGLKKALWWVFMKRWEEDLAITRRLDSLKGSLQDEQQYSAAKQMGEGCEGCFAFFEAIGLLIAIVVSALKGSVVALGGISAFLFIAEGMAFFPFIRLTIYRFRRNRK